MTETEYMNRRTFENTNIMAYQCFKCGRIEAHTSAEKTDKMNNSEFSDGEFRFKCSKCGGFCNPIGHLKPSHKRERTKSAFQIPPIQHEAQEQTALFRWAKYAEQKYPELKLLYHIPNGGKRNSKEAANLKKQGVKPGVPDLCLPICRGIFHGLYIELKYGKNKPSKIQTEWIENLRQQGYWAYVCYGWESAQCCIEDYLKIKDKNEV